MLTATVDFPTPNLHKDTPIIFLTCSNPPFLALEAYLSF